MTARTLPVEVISRIVQHCLLPANIAPLCRLNKAFQAAAERRLYGELVLGDVNLAYHVCASLVSCGGAKGPYVQRFWLYTDTRRAVIRSHFPSAFWEAVQLALATMTELKELLIVDPALNNTWILDPEDVKFQLHTAKFRLVWDENMVAFLQTQPKLKHLQTMDAPDLSEVCTLPAGQLQELESFDGPLLVAAQVLSCPRLAYLRTSADSEVVHLVSQFVEAAVKADIPLRNLHVNCIPESLLSETLEAITSDPKWCTRLKHLGVIMLPFANVSDLKVSLLTIIHTLFLAA